MGSGRQATARLGLGGMAGTLHDDAIVIDGLIIANFSREVFLDMRRGGLTAANCTAAMERSGWSEARIRGVIGGNWLRFLADAWGG